ncbi:MAG: hypothetical protein K6G62_06085, partial [Eubacterium sp.]|nr:hypothetical protein [Eubacterium sp.]
LQAIQHTLTSTAPVFMGAISSGVLYYVITYLSLAPWQRVLAIYGLVSILMHMTMSDQDFEVMWKGMPVVYLLVFFACFVMEYSLVSLHIFS